MVTSRIVDPDGSTHVRIDRTYRGLPVLGGDLVVHRGPEGQWRGVSQTLRSPVRLGTTPRLSAQLARSIAVAPTRLTRSIGGFKAAGKARLVIDATSGTARLAWRIGSGGRHADGTPSRMASYVDARTGALLRREEGIVRPSTAPARRLYGGTVPLQLTQSGSTYQLKDPTRGGTYTTDFGNKTDSVWCQLFGIGCTTAGTLFTSPDTSVRQRVAPAAVSRRRSTRSTAPT